jgi:thioredoxin 1
MAATPGSAARIPVLGADDFDGERLRRPGTWAVAFVADWCPFCRRFRPIFETARGRGRFELAYGDVTDYETPLWERFDLKVVPTVVAFRDGAPVFRANGRFARGLNAADVEKVVAALAQPPGAPP